MLAKSGSLAKVSEVIELVTRVMSECLRLAGCKQTVGHVCCEHQLITTTLSPSSTSLTLSSFQLHLATCGQVLVGCELCGREVPRGELPAHMGSSCPKGVVSCPFTEHGCCHKMVRADLDEHLAQSTQYHLHVSVCSFGSCGFCHRGMVFIQKIAVPIFPFCSPRFKSSASAAPASNAP